MEQYPESVKKDFRGILEREDRDGSGSVSIEEFLRCLTLMGLFTTPEDAQFLSKHFDTNDDGKLSIDEILENMDVLHEHSLKADQLKEAFLAIDRDRNGYIRQRELLSVLIHNDFMTVKDARSLIRKLQRTFDRDGDGKFNYAEFVEMFGSREFSQVINELSNQCD